MSSAFILIDLQNDFFSGGSLPVPNGNAILPIAQQLINRAKKTNCLVIATQDWHPINHISFSKNLKKTAVIFSKKQNFWPVHCVQNTHGAKLHFSLNISQFDLILRKGTNANIDSYSIFFDNNGEISTQLDSWLKNKKITILYIMGLTTDYCVFHSVIDGLKLGYKVVVITDGCRGVDIKPNSSKKALEYMRSAGAYLHTSKEIKFNNQE